MQSVLPFGMYREDDIITILWWEQHLKVGNFNLQLEILILTGLSCFQNICYIVLSCSTPLQWENNRRIIEMIEIDQMAAAPPQSREVWLVMREEGGSFSSSSSTHLWTVSLVVLHIWLDKKRIKQVENQTNLIMRRAEQACPPTSSHFPNPAFPHPMKTKIYEMSLSWVKILKIEFLVFLATLLDA